MFEQIREHEILKQSLQEEQQFATSSQVCNTKKGSQLETLEKDSNL